MRRGLAAVALSATLLAVWATPAPAQSGSIQFDPGSLSFGPQAIGTASAPQKIGVGLYNGASFFGLQISGPDFLVAANSCPMYGSPGITGCQIEVIFHPLYRPAGPRWATLSVSSGFATVSLSGTAVDPVRTCIKKARKKFRNDPARKRKAIKACQTNYG